MTSKMKILAIVLVAVTVTGLLIYIPLSLAASQNNYGNARRNSPISVNDDEVPLENLDLSRRWLLRRFIANWTPVEVQGTVVALVRRILVLNVEDRQVRIILPFKWIVDGEELETGDFFETGYLTRGQNITVKALKGTLVTRDNYSIYVLFGYEIINATNVHAYAVLPFNIEAS